VRVDGIDKLVLEDRASSPFYSSCEAVEFDGLALSEALRKLTSDQALLEATPITVWLPGNTSVTYFGRSITASEAQGRHYVHYYGKAKSHALSMFQISVGPDGAAKRVIYFGLSRYVLELTHNPPIHHLCEEDPSFLGEM